MARTPKTRRFNSALVPFVLALVRRAGKDPSKLEKKYLPTQVPEVSLPELGSLLTDVSKELADPLFGLHCAQAMTRGSYGLLEFGLRSAPTLRIAMEQLGTYGALINPLVRWSTEPDGDELSLHHRAPQKGGVGRQGNMFTVARILQIAREMMGDDLKPVRAWFAHDEKVCPPELAAHLGTKDIAFGRTSNGLTFSAKDLARKPLGADADLNRALELHGAAVLAACGDRDALYEQARGAVLSLLPKGDATLAKTAKRLHVTARTLQRRLTEEGVSFGGLLTEVRRTQAERLLARSDASLAEVAEQVGYADTGAFVRAFRTWTGTTPGKYREAG
ncbi:MAG: AraC family transcriptional regulator ligand-binding domain-containing protein [Archangium sp.]|nr:AraC family transcriptional regulator ligand-binding domain-containing protein [Archangium sp.]MDP3152047.1 AraC family transcriptional regulator ligand-binding domain-containing protein [Archangium sp.]MDP3575467.1 AraC family transcriptional regulator ligand-binding domain-containing protein [Archangium sp.]